MSLQLKRHEDTDAAVRRIVGQRLDQIIKALRPRSMVSERRIHKIRLKIKQTRAILRLVRDEIGKTRFNHENQMLRDTGRLLSQIRDVEAPVEVFNELWARHKLAIDETVGRRIADVLDSRRRHVRSQIQPTMLASVRRELKAAGRRVRKWKFKQKGWKSVEKGLRKSYADAREIGFSSHRLGNDLEQHELRKRVKDLRYQLAFLKKMDPGLNSKRMEEMRVLTDYLGTARDLWLLKTILEEALVDDPPREVVKLIESRCQELSEEADELFVIQFAAKESTFARRCREAWKKWRQRD